MPNAWARTVSAVDESVSVGVLADRVGVLADDRPLRYADASELRSRASATFLRRFGWLVRATAVVVPVAAVVVVARDKRAGLEIVVLSAVWFLALGARRHAPWLRQLSRRVPLAAVWGTALALLGASLVGFWMPSLGLTPSQLLLTGIATLTATVALELTVGGSLSRRSRVVIVGDAAAGAAVADELSADPVPKFDLVDVLDAGSITRDAITDADLIVIAGGQAETVQTILDAGQEGVRVVDFHGFFEYAFGRIPLAGLSPMWFMAVLHVYQRVYSRVTKRAFDCVVASVALVLLAPLLAVTAAVIRLSSGSPVFYRQVRLGESGNTFEMLKFRTMVDGAEADGHAMWADQWDHRLTPFGGLLRKGHIDELPQLWNVLRGEMSVVGPRPERPEFLERLALEIPFWTRRHLVKPGITGWAQVNAGYASDVDGAERKLSYDLYYLKHRSLALDVAITAKTIAVAIRGTGAR